MTRASTAAEGAIGVGGQSIIWFNRFTPSPTSYPFRLDEVQIQFVSTTQGVSLLPGAALHRHQ